MDNTPTPETTPRPEPTITQKIDQISSSVSAYRKWDQERLAGQSAARMAPEMTAEQRLGETLTQSENEVKAKTEAEFDQILLDIKETPEDDDQTKLIKLHKARTLAKSHPPILADGVPEKTLRILDGRPDLLKNPDIYDLYSRVLLEDQCLLQQTANLLKNPQEAPPPEPVLEIAKRLSEEEPTSRFAIFEGFMRGVIAYKDGPQKADPKTIGSQDRKSDGYPLDQITATQSAEKTGFLGAGTMQNLSERASIWTKDQFTQRGKATLIGAALAVTMAGTIDARTQNRNPSIEAKIQDNFVAVVDKLLGDEQLREATTHRENPLQPVAEIIWNADAKLKDKINTRDLAVRDQLAAQETARQQKIAIEAEKQKLLEAEAAKLAEAEQQKEATAQRPEAPPPPPSEKPKNFLQKFFKR